MPNRCESCGAIIPRGQFTCDKCKSDKIPCPSCRTPRPWLVKILPTRGIFTCYFVECRMCHRCGPTRIGKSRAIQAWNRGRRNG